MHNIPTTPQLLKRLAEGQSEAYAFVFDALAPRLRHYAILQLGSPDDADDVLQEAFTRLARQGERLHRVENLTAYLFHIVRNESIRLRNRRASRDQSLEPTELFEIAGDDDQHESLDRAEWVTRALAALPEDMRELVDLKIYGNLTYREIADVMSLPQGTVVARYQRALSQLERLLRSEV